MALLDEISGCFRAAQCLSLIFIVSLMLLWGILLYGILIIYRIYFSALCGFPGPKLAASTGWYETYFELFKRGGGQFTFQIEKLHERYGPIIRINPHELHIHDPEFYETIYTTSQGYDKPSSIQHRFGAPYASFSTPEHELHRQRRAVITPFFSKRKILQQAPSIQLKVDKVCSRIADDYAGKRKTLVLNDLFSSSMADVITKYAFNQSYDFLDKEDFRSPFTAAIRGFKDIVHLSTQFPWLPRILTRLPDTLVTIFHPPMAAVIEFQREMRSLIRGAQHDRERSKDNKSEGTIFNELLQSNLPPQELSMERLKDEAVSIIGAGIESSKWACTVACFHIISHPTIQRRLGQELTAAIPDPQSMPSLSKLEQLPYLTACVEECIRLAYGQMARSPRISRGTPIAYGSWTIPPGVPVSMDTWHMHHDESIFPNSFAFVPERWLGNPRGPDGQKYLTRYMTSFGKGTRMCLGMNLAYAEIRMVVAALFRRFNFELFETNLEDVTTVKDVIAPDVKPDSKGVRVTVKS